MVWLHLEVRIFQREQVPSSGFLSSVLKKKDNGDQNGPKSHVGLLLSIAKPEECSVVRLACLIMEEWKSMFPNSDMLDIMRIIDEKRPTMVLSHKMPIAQIWVDQGKGRADGLDQYGVAGVFQKPCHHAPQRLPSVDPEFEGAIRTARKRRISQVSPISEQPDVPHDVPLSSVEVSVPSTPLCTGKIQNPGQDAPFTNTTVPRRPHQTDNTPSQASILRSSQPSTVIYPPGVTKEKIQQIEKTAREREALIQEARSMAENGQPDTSITKVAQSIQSLLDEIQELKNLDPKGRRLRSRYMSWRKVELDTLLGKFGDHMADLRKKRTLHLDPEPQAEPGLDFESQSDNLASSDGEQSAETSDESEEEFDEGEKNNNVADEVQQVPGQGKPAETDETEMPAEPAKEVDGDGLNKPSFTLSQRAANLHAGLEAQLPVQLELAKNPQENDSNSSSDNSEQDPALGYGRPLQRPTNSVFFQRTSSLSTESSQILTLKQRVELVRKVRTEREARKNQFSTSQPRPDIYDPVPSEVESLDDMGDILLNGNQCKIRRPRTLS